MHRPGIAAVHGFLPAGNDAAYLYDDSHSSGSNGDLLVYHLGEGWIL